MLLFAKEGRRNEGGDKGGEGEEEGSLASLI